MQVPLELRYSRDFDINFVHTVKVCPSNLVCAADNQKLDGNQAAKQLHHRVHIDVDGFTTTEMGEGTYELLACQARFSFSLSHLQNTTSQRR